jgi:hypothetical protein
MTMPSWPNFFILDTVTKKLEALEALPAKIASLEKQNYRQKGSNSPSILT